MLNILGFNVSFIEISVFFGILIILLLTEIMVRKDTKKIELSEKIGNYSGQVYINSKTKSKYGEIYNNNLSFLFKEGSILGKIGNLLIPNKKELQNKLSLVNSSLTVEEFISIKVLSLIAGVLILIVGFIFNLGIPFYCIGGFAVLVSLLLDNQIYVDKLEKRKAEILRDLPNFLDLLYSACKSGHNIIPAITKISQKYPGALATDFQKTITTFKINGGDFQEACEEMINRNNIDELSNVLSDIIISYEKGDDVIVETLKQESDMMKEYSIAHNEEIANKKSATLTVPMMIFFLLLIIAFLLIPMLANFTVIMG